jgi:hypothetical protein
MSHPLISFLTNACRTRRYVGEPMDSVLPQTRLDWESIVENGNSDEMAWGVEKYTNPQVGRIPAADLGLIVLCRSVDRGERN